MDKNQDIELRSPNFQACEGTCRESWARLTRYAGQDLCEQCHREARQRDQRVEEGKQITFAREALVRKALVAAGYSPRELAAVLPKIPPELVGLAQGEHLDALVGGETPARGWGFSGYPGTGKSCALAVWIRAGLDNRLRHHARRLGAEVLEPWTRWVSWPSYCNWLRWTAQKPDGYEEAYEDVQRLAAVPVLVLDDLGAERARGDYTEDWATSQLEYLVDARYRELLPTWYTTNVSDVELVNRYGGHFFSRLVGHNPLLVLEGRQDLRLLERPADEKGAS